MYALSAVTLLRAENSFSEPHILKPTPTTQNTALTMVETDTGMALEAKWRPLGEAQISNQKRREGRTATSAAS